MLRLCGGVALASQNVPSSYTCAFMKMCKDGKGNPVGEPVKSTADTWSIWTPGRSVRWTWGYIYNPNIGHFNRTMKWPSLWFAFLINPRIGRPLSKFAAEAMGELYSLLLWSCPKNDHIKLIKHLRGFLDRDLSTLRLVDSDLSPAYRSGKRKNHGKSIAEGYYFL